MLILKIYLRKLYVNTSTFSSTSEWKTIYRYFKHSLILYNQYFNYLKQIRNQWICYAKKKEKKENHLQPQKQGKSGDVEVSLGPEQSHHGQVCSVGVVFKIHFICGGSILVNFSNGIYNSSEKFWREHMLSRHHCYFYK